MSARRGRVITQAELSDYSRKLATAVTEAIYYFVGHGDPAPPDETRYLAVTAAHIIHMLRDAFEDTGAGYFNIPGEFLQATGYLSSEIWTARLIASGCAGEFNWRAGISR